MPRLDGQVVQHVDVVGLAVRYMDESGDIAAQIEQGMQLDGRFGRTEGCPWKQREVQVDGRGIQGVGGIVQLDTEAVVAIEPARPPYKQRLHVRPDTPIASFVGIGQCRAFDRGAKAHAIQFRLVC